MPLPSFPETTHARTGRFTQPTLQREPWLGAWLLSNALIGGFSGLVLGLAHQLTQARFGSGTASVGERGLSVLLSGIGYAGLMLVVAALAGLWLLLPRPRRSAAVVISAFLMGVGVVAHLLAEATYVVAGTPLTLGALEFFANSWRHMLGALLEGYWQALLLVGVLSLLMAGGAAAALMRAAHDRWVSGRRLAVAAVVGLGVLFGLNELVARDRGAWAEVWASAPELAFWESVHLEARERRALERSDRLRPEPGRELSAARLWGSAVKARHERRPNVLLILLESVGMDYLGYARDTAESADESVTPNIDRMAAGALNMRRAWTTATHSNYAQMAVLSSLFPRRTPGLDTYEHLDYPRVLLHDFLHRLSYRTATISSQDETWQGMLRFETTDTPNLFFHARDHRGPLVRTGTEEIVPDHLTAERVRRFILARQSQPWGVYVNFQMTHFPYRLPPGVHGPFSPANPDPKTFHYLSYPKTDLERARNKYRNALHYVDEQVGLLYRALEDSGQLDDTIVVVTSDHGELFYQHGMVTHGRSLYETEARVPLLVHWPRGLDPAVSDAPVSTLDVLPTLADLLEVAPHPSFQGESFAHPERIDPASKAIFLNIQGMRSGEAIVCWPYKLIKMQSQRRPQLYQLARDPEETNDLYRQGFTLAKRLRHLLRAQMRAQLEYHRPDNERLREERFQPRLLRCNASLDAQPD